MNRSPVDDALRAACKARDDIGSAIQAHVETIARERQAIKALCDQAAEIDDTIDHLLERRLA